MKTRTFVVTVIIPDDVDGSKAQVKEIVDFIRCNTCELNFDDCAIEVKEIKGKKGVEE